MIYCHKCGAKLEEDSKFCRLCGTKIFFDEKATPVLVEESVFIEKPDFVVEPNLIEKSNLVENHHYIAKFNMVENSDIMVKPNLVEKPDFVENSNLVEKPDFVEKSNLVENPDSVVKPILVEKPDFVVNPILVEKPDFVIDPVFTEDKVQNQGYPQQWNEAVNINTVFPEKPQGKFKSKKKLFLSVAACIVVIAILIIVIGGLRSGNTSFDFYEEDCISIVNDDDTAYIITPDSKITEIDTKHSDAKYSMNRSKIAVIKDYDSEVGGDLYVIDASDEKQIDKNVIDFVISDSGDGIAYLTDDDYEDETVRLMLYTDGKTKQISDEVYVSDYDDSYLVISPDGNTVAYANYKDEKTGYISVNGKSPKQIGENKICFAVSDDAKYLYYFEAKEDSEEADLYVKAGDNENKLVSGCAELNFSFNKDYSQAMFSYDDSTYISISGNDKEKLADSFWFYLITPDNAILNFDYEIRTYATESFIGKLFVSDGDIYYLNKNLDMKKVGDSTSGFGGVTADLDKLVYSDSSGELYVVANLSSGDPKSKHLDKAENIVNLRITEDAEQIYYVNDNDELHVISQENIDKKIADDVNWANLSIVGERLFFFTDYNGDYGTLMYTTGSKTEKLEDAEDVSSFYNLGTGIIYYSGDFEKTTVYGSTDGKKFEKIIEDIDISD